MFMQVLLSQPDPFEAVKHPCLHGRNLGLSIPRKLPNGNEKRRPLWWHTSFCGGPINFQHDHTIQECISQIPLI